MLAINTRTRQRSVSNASTASDFSIISPTSSSTNNSSTDLRIPDTHNTTRSRSASPSIDETVRLGPNVVIAMHDYSPPDDADNNCLAFRSGQVITVINRDPSGWWDGQLEDGRRGWFPSNYVNARITLLTEEEPLGMRSFRPGHAHTSSTASTTSWATTSSGLSNTTQHLHRNHRNHPSLDSVASEAMDPYFPPIMASLLHGISFLQNAVRANRVTHFQPSTACIISCVRGILAATGTLQRDALVLEQFPILKEERRRILTVLAQLVQQAKTASDLSLDTDAQDAEVENMMKLGGRVFSHVRTFLSLVVRCGIELPEEDIPYTATPDTGLSASTNSPSIPISASESTLADSARASSPNGYSPSTSPTTTPTQYRNRPPDFGNHHHHLNQRPGGTRILGPRLRESGESPKSLAQLRQEQYLRDRSPFSTHSSSSTPQNPASSSTSLVATPTAATTRGYQYPMRSHRSGASISSISSMDSASSASSSDSLLPQSPPPFPSGPSTVVQVLEALRYTHDHYLSTIAAFIGHAHSHSRSSHASSTGVLYDLVKEIVEMVCKLLSIVEAVIQHPDVPTNRIAGLKKAKEGLFCVTSGLAESVRLLTNPSVNAGGGGGEEAEKQVLLRSATDALKSGTDCVNAVKSCLNRSSSGGPGGQQRLFVINLPDPEDMILARPPVETVKTPTSGSTLGSASTVTVTGQGSTPTAATSSTSGNVTGIRPLPPPQAYQHNQRHYAAEDQDLTIHAPGQTLTSNASGSTSTSPPTVTSSHSHISSPMQRPREISSGSEVSSVSKTSSSSGSMWPSLRSDGTRATSPEDDDGFVSVGGKDLDVDREEDKDADLDLDVEIEPPSSPPLTAEGDLTMTTWEGSARGHGLGLGHHHHHRSAAAQAQLEERILNGDLPSLPLDDPPHHYSNRLPGSSQGATTANNNNGSSISNTSSAPSSATSHPNWSGTNAHSTTPYTLYTPGDKTTWMYGHDYPPDDIAYNNDGHLVGATMPVLIEKMTPQDSLPDSAFLPVFFMTFRLFSTPVALVDALIERYNLTPPPGLDEEDVGVWQQVKGIPVRLRVSNFLKMWIEVYWKVGIDDVVLDVLMDFVGEGLRSLFPGPAARILESLRVRKAQSLGLMNGGGGDSGSVQSSGASTVTVESPLIWSSASASGHGDSTSGGQSTESGGSSSQTVANASGPPGSIPPPLLPLSPIIHDHRSRDPGMSINPPSLFPLGQAGLNPSSSSSQMAAVAGANWTGEIPRPTMTRTLLAALRKREQWDGIVISDFDALELARQLTIMECRLYCAIMPDEVLESGEGGGASKGGGGASGGVVKNANVKAVSSLSTVITGWVAETILNELDLKKRTGLVKFFVKVADRCTGLNNYATSRSILAALDSSTISRLRQTWAGLPQKYKIQLDALRKLADHSRNYHEYRSRLRNTAPPAVPFLGLYLTDVTFCREGNPSYRTSPTNPNKKLINFNKFHKLARIVQDMQRFQVPYNLKAITEVQDYLAYAFEKAKNSGDLDDLYRRSLLVEPKQPADNPPTSDVRQLFSWARSNSQPQSSS